MIRTKIIYKGKLLAFFGIFGHEASICRKVSSIAKELVSNLPLSDYDIEIAKGKVTIVPTNYLAEAFDEKYFDIAIEKLEAIKKNNKNLLIEKEKENEETEVVN